MSKQKRDSLVYIQDILDSIEKVEKYAFGLTFEEFKKNNMVIDAIIRNFEIIGEAVKHIPNTIKGRYPDIEWKEAAGFRDVLVHEYFGVEVEALWDTIKKNIPFFKKKIAKILKHECFVQED